MIIVLLINPVYAVTSLCPATALKDSIHACMRTPLSDIDMTQKHACIKIMCSNIVTVATLTSSVLRRPHWWEVVGPNHHSAFLTTTHIVSNNTKLLLFMKLDCHLAECNHHSDHSGQNPVCQFNFHK